MSRKTAAQKARAAAAAAAPKTAIQEPKKQQNHAKVNNQPASKRAKLTHESSPASDYLPSHDTETAGPVHNSSHRQPGHPRAAPPEPPASIPSSTVILPPEADDVKLREKHDMHFIGVAGNSKMESKIVQTMTALRSTLSGGKSVIVALTAPSKASNKCIGITEIVKREFVKTEGKKLYQYTGCWTRLETHDAKQQADDGKNDEDGDVDEEDENAFEDAHVAMRKQVRNATCLVVYLSHQAIPRLRDKYGEQVHEGEKG